MSFRFRVNQNPLEIEFDAGSIREGLSILQEEETAVAEFFATAVRLASAHGTPGEVAVTASDGAAAVTTETAAPATKRKRRTNAEIAADAAKAAAATAPDPLPVPAAVAPALPPSAPPPPPLAVAPPVADGLAVPSFLQRNADNSLPVAPVAPVAPPVAAPVAPAPVAPTLAPAPAPAPPAPIAPASPADIGHGAQAIIENLKARSGGTPDGGQVIADWVTSNFPDVLTKGANFDDIRAVLPFTKNAILAQVAGALGVAL